MHGGCGAPQASKFETQVQVDSCGFPLDVRIGASRPLRRALGQLPCQSRLPADSVIRLLRRSKAPQTGWASPNAPHRHKSTRAGHALSIQTISRRLGAAVSPCSAQLGDQSFWGPESGAGCGMWTEVRRVRRSTRPAGPLEPRSSGVTGVSSTWKCVEVFPSRVDAQALARSGDPPGGKKTAGSTAPRDPHGHVRCVEEAERVACDPPRGVLRRTACGVSPART